jgi:DNA transformation protein and related proteins
MCASRRAEHRSGARALPACVEQFIRRATPLGPVVARPMFGGYGFYLEGMIFAIEADGAIWLKVDAESKIEFVAAGSRPFVYEGKKRPVEMPYWSVPADADANFMHWAKLALASARRSIARKQIPGASRRKRD